MCSENHVRLQPEDVLVVAVYHSWDEAEEDHAIFRAQVHTPIEQEMDRSADLAVPDDVLTRNVLTLIHLDNTLVAESFLEELKAGPKLINRIAEEKLYKLRLHFGRQLLVEFEFFYNHVMITAEGNSEVLVDVIS